MSRFYHWVKLGFSSIGPIKWIILLVLGTGTATNESVQSTVTELFESEPATLPIPEGETVLPPPGINPEVRQSLGALNSAVNKQASQIKALQIELRELEERRMEQSDAKDLKLDARLTEIEGLVD